MNASMRQILALEMATVAADSDNTPSGIPHEDAVQLYSLVQKHLGKLDRASVRQIVLIAYRLGSEHCHRAMEASVNEDEPLTLADLEKRAVVRALSIAAGNVTIAAKLLAIGKTSLYRKLRKYGILQGRRRQCPNCGYDLFHCHETTVDRPDDTSQSQELD